MQELIYNQHDIPKEQWRYGFRASAAVGCGWVATYNALVLLGMRVNIAQLIRRFERQLPLIHGNTGTFAAAPAAMLKKLGYRVESTLNRRKFDALARSAPVCILFYYWRDGWKLGSHFVALRWQDGGFVGYNTFRNSAAPDHYGSSLDAFLKRQGYFGCFLTAVYRK